MQLSTAMAAINSGEAEVIDVASRLASGDSSNTRSDDAEVADGYQRQVALG